jgi:hypothetical protein
MEELVIEGLVGDAVDFLCGDPEPVDEGHATGAALEMVSVATSTRDVKQVRAGTGSVVPAGTRWARASPAGVRTAWKVVGGRSSSGDERRRIIESRLA